jgi:hypothetical protein
MLALDYVSSLPPVEDPEIGGLYGIEEDSLVKRNNITNKDDIGVDDKLLPKPKVLNTVASVKSLASDAAPRNSNTTSNGNSNSNSGNGTKTTNEKKAEGIKNPNSNGQADASSLSESAFDKKQAERIKQRIINYLSDLSDRERYELLAHLNRCGDDIKKLEALETKIKSKYN